MALKRRLGITRLTGIGVVGMLVCLLFCGTVMTPLLGAALVAVGFAAVARHVDGALMAAGIAALAVAGWWLSAGLCPTCRITT